MLHLQQYHNFDLIDQLFIKFLKSVRKSISAAEDILGCL